MFDCICFCSLRNSVSYNKTWKVFSHSLKLMLKQIFAKFLVQPTYVLIESGIPSQLHLLLDFFIFPRTLLDFFLVIPCRILFKDLPALILTNI